MTLPPHHLLSPTPGARVAPSNDTDSDLDLVDAHTSPLGDYLAEAERSFESLGSPLNMDRDETARRKRPRTSRDVSPLGMSMSMASRLDARTPSPSPVPLRPFDLSEAGPSRLALKSPARIGSTSPSPAPSPSPAHSADASAEHDEFAERFRYLVASSGLLEKTQLASLGSPWPSLDDGLSHETRASTHEGPPQDTDPFVSKRWLMWDIITAAVVLAASIAYMVSPTVPVVLAAALLAGGALYWRRIVPEPPQQVDAPRSDDVASPPPPEEAKPESKKLASTGRARVMDRLETLLTESKNLDRCIASALQMLAPRPDDPEHAHDLRIALHRLFEDMTDSMAGATSSLTPLCDRSELAVLGDMYDVQLTPSQRRRRESSSDEEIKSPSPVKMYHRRASSTSAAFADLPRPTLLSPRFARTPIRGGLGSGTLTASPIDVNDRFTQLPVRSRSRHQRASSEWSPRASPMYRSPMAPEVRHQDVDDDGVMSATSTESSSVPASLPDDRMGSFGSMLSPPPTKSQPFTPKRASPLVQSLARLDMPNTAMSPPFPVMNTKPSQSPFRRSLQQMPYIPSPAVSSHEKAQSLAVARATTSMSSDKRRSLQTPFNGGNIAVDFARDQAILATGANLTRARSLPHSEKAKVTSASSAAGSQQPSQQASPEDRNADAPGLKRLSLLSDNTSVSSPLSKRPGDAVSLVDRMALGYGTAPLRPPQPTRVPSVSPLTAGGLKASCLGVHLKRRRMVCCLLGLKLCEPEDSSYWDDVAGILQGVNDAMAAALARLEMLRGEAERECAAAQAVADAAGSRSSTPPPRISSYLRGGMNFAPRDSAEQALLASMDDMQRTLARLWARCDEVRAASAEGKTDFAAVWTDMRNDIGSMLRHVDRNRLRLESSESGYDDDDDAVRERDETPVPQHVPDFVHAWRDEPDAAGPEEIERLVDADGDDEGETPLVDSLPPPGTDEVYEATTAEGAGSRARSTLSREERIQLQREARARGMTFAQLEGSKDPARAAEIERQIEAARLRAVSGDMVQELQGMFGAIRRRKGMSGGADASTDAAVPSAS